MHKKMLLSAILFVSAQSFAQTTTPDKHVVAMQRMMLKLITAAPTNFAAIKGTEESKNGNTVFYTANLVNTVTDPAEMKEALATDFFGAMLTTDDHIVVAPAGTIFLARYVDDGEVSMTDMVTTAFTGMPAYIGKADATAKTEKIAGATADEATYILTYKNSFVAKLSCNTKLGTAMLIIGIQK